MQSKTPLQCSFAVLCETDLITHLRMTAVPKSFQYSNKKDFNSSIPIHFTANTQYMRASAFSALSVNQKEINLCGTSMILNAPVGLSYTPCVMLRFKQKVRCPGTGQDPGAWPQLLLGWVFWGWPEPLVHRWCGVKRKEAVDPAKAPQVPSIWISPLLIPSNGGLFFMEQAKPGYEDGQWPTMSLWIPIMLFQKKVGK